MKAESRAWLFISHGHREEEEKMERTSVCILFSLIIAAGCSVSPSLLYTFSQVGLPAVLPCAWHSYVKSHINSPYIQWQRVSSMVFERMGDERYQSDEYQGRADVPQPMLVSGNCSLLLSDVRFSDAGLYRSFLVVGHSSNRNRIFIQSVQLFVTDHKQEYWVEHGKDLELDLYTSQASTLVFQNSTAPGWRVLWQRGQGQGQDWGGVEERDGKLVIREVNHNQTGTYRVMDSEGLALSTVKINIREPVHDKVTQERIEETQTVFGRSSTNTPVLQVTLLLVFLLVTAF